MSGMMARIGNGKVKSAKCLLGRVWVMRGDLVSTCILLDFLRFK